MIRSEHVWLPNRLFSRSPFLQIPKEEENPVRYVLMLIPNVHKLSMVLYIPVATHGHTPSIGISSVAGTARSSLGLVLPFLGTTQLSLHLSTTPEYITYSTYIIGGKTDYYLLSL
jgi:hypothetical protein